MQPTHLPGRRSRPASGFSHEGWRRLVAIYLSILCVVCEISSSVSADESSRLKAIADDLASLAKDAQARGDAQRNRPNTGISSTDKKPLSNYPLSLDIKILPTEIAAQAIHVRLRGGNLGESLLRQILVRGSRSTWAAVHSFDEVYPPMSIRIPGKSSYIGDTFSRSTNTTTHWYGGGKGSPGDIHWDRNYIISSDKDLMGWYEVRSHAIEQQRPSVHELHLATPARFWSDLLADIQEHLKTGPKFEPFLSSNYDESWPVAVQYLGRYAASGQQNVRPPGVLTKQGHEAWKDYVSARRESTNAITNSTRRNEDKKWENSMVAYKAGQTAVLAMIAARIEPLIAEAIKSSAADPTEIASVIKTLPEENRDRWLKSVEKLRTDAKPANQDRLDKLISALKP